MLDLTRSTDKSNPRQNKPGIEIEWTQSLHTIDALPAAAPIGRRAVIG
jgi:hypothetical protein